MIKQVKHVKWEPDFLRDVSGTDTETGKGITTSEKRDIARSYRHLSFTPVSGTAEELPVDIAFTQHTTDHLLEAPCFFDLFLSFFSNIESLEVDDVFEWDHCRYWFKYIAANVSRFDNLKKVAVSAVFRLEDITPLLTLPTPKYWNSRKSVAWKQDEGYLSGKWKTDGSISLNDRLASNCYTFLRRTCPQPRSHRSSGCFAL